MSQTYFLNDSRGKSHYKFINTTKTRENSNNLYSVEYDSYNNSKVDIGKEKIVENRLLEPPFLTLKANPRITEEKGTNSDNSEQDNDLFKLESFNESWVDDRIRKKTNKNFTSKKDEKFNNQDYIIKKKNFLIGLKLKKPYISESKIYNSLKDKKESLTETNFCEDKNGSEYSYKNRRAYLYKNFFNVIPSNNNIKLKTLDNKEYVNIKTREKVSLLNNNLKTSSLVSFDSKEKIKSRMETENDDCSLNRLNEKNSFKTYDKFKKVKLIMLDDKCSNQIEVQDDLVNSTLNDFSKKDYNAIEIPNKVKNKFYNEIDAKNKINIEFEKIRKKIYHKTSVNLFLEEKYKNNNNSKVTDEKYFFNNNGRKNFMGSEILNKQKLHERYCFQSKFNSDGFRIKRANIGKDFIFTSPDFNNFIDLRKEFFNEINNYDLISDKKLSKDYYLIPIIKEETLNCKIKILTNNNKFGLLYPIYTLHVDSTDRFILAAKKVKITSASSYLFSLDVNTFDVKSESYLGKLNSNFLGNKFKIIDYKNKNEKNFIEEEGSKEISEIDYKINIFGLFGPRKMRVKIKKQQTSSNENTNKSYKSIGSENKKIKITNIDNDQDNCEVFRNKMPDWSEVLRSYVLNFNGRVKKSSPKNFQLIKENDSNTVFLQFGKIDEKTYSMDFQYPFSIFQAFAICISSLATKILCE